MYLRHGHVHVFWNALITLAEQTKVNGTVDPLSEELGHVVLISPWVTDLPIHTSGLRSEEWAMILGTPGRHVGALSDVLQGLADLDCKINLLMLDSGDRYLSMDDSLSMRKETELVRRLKRGDENIRVFKKFGLHTKAYAFPSCVLEGSANLTYRGMLGNMEQLAYVERDVEPDRFLSALNMIAGHLDGSQSYHARTILRLDHSEAENANRNADEETQSGVEILSEASTEIQREEEYAYPPPAYELGALPEQGSDRLNAHEIETMKRHVHAFEHRLRSVIVAYYEQYESSIESWSKTPMQGKATWMKRLKIRNPSKTTRVSPMNDRPHTELKKKGKRFPDEMKLMGWDVDNPSAHALINGGTTLSDLRVALVGSDLNKSGHYTLFDAEGVDLYKHALALFAAELSNANPAQFKDNREVGQQFWTDLIKDDMRLTNDARGIVNTHTWTQNPVLTRKKARDFDQALRNLFDLLIKPAERLFQLNVEE